MLTIRKIGSGQAGDYSAYLAGRADDEREAWKAQRGDYYTGIGDDGAPDMAGIWRGDASVLDALGVAPDLVVQREELARALRGLRADNGEVLRRPGANGVVNSHDLTMGAPKSVSVLWAQSGSERRTAIEQAMREAAESTVRYMALTTGCVQRRTDSGERVWEPARGVASAQFVHHTARRASSAEVPDPHLQRAGVGACAWGGVGAVRASHRPASEQRRSSRSAPACTCTASWSPSSAVTSGS